MLRSALKALALFLILFNRIQAQTTVPITGAINGVEDGADAIFKLTVPIRVQDSPGGTFVDVASTPRTFTVTDASDVIFNLEPNVTGGGVAVYPSYSFWEVIITNDDGSFYKRQLQITCCVTQNWGDTVVDRPGDPGENYASRTGDTFTGNMQFRGDVPMNIRAQASAPPTGNIAGDIFLSSVDYVLRVFNGVTFVSATLTLTGAAGTVNWITQISGDRIGALEDPQKSVIQDSGILQGVADVWNFTGLLGATVAATETTINLDSSDVDLGQASGTVNWTTQISGDRNGPLEDPQKVAIQDSGVPQGNADVLNFTGLLTPTVNTTDADIDITEADIEAVIDHDDIQGITATNHHNAIAPLDITTDVSLRHNADLEVVGGQLAVRDQSLLLTAAQIITDVLWTQLDFTGSTLTDIVVRPHGALQTILGNGEYHLSLAERDDLTDGGDSAAHFHSADRARAVHTGTQLKSTISDFDHATTHNSGGGDQLFLNNLAGTVTWTSQINFAGGSLGDIGTLDTLNKAISDSTDSVLDITGNVSQTLDLSINENLYVAAVRGNIVDSTGDPILLWDTVDATTRENFNIVGNYLFLGGGAFRRNPTTLQLQFSHTGDDDDFNDFGTGTGSGFSGALGDTTLGVLAYDAGIADRVQVGEDGIQSVTDNTTRTALSDTLYDITVPVSITTPTFGLTVPYVSLSGPTGGANELVAEDGNMGITGNVSPTGDLSVSANTYYGQGSYIGRDPGSNDLGFRDVGGVFTALKNVSTFTGDFNGSPAFDSTGNFAINDDTDLTGDLTLTSGDADVTGDITASANLAGETIFAGGDVIVIDHDHGDDVSDTDKVIIKYDSVLDQLMASVNGGAFANILATAAGVINVDAVFDEDFSNNTGLDLTASGVADIDVNGTQEVSVDDTVVTLPTNSVSLTAAGMTVPYLVTTGSPDGDNEIVSQTIKANELDLTEEMGSLSNPLLKIANSTSGFFENAINRIALGVNSTLMVQFVSTSGTTFNRDVFLTSSTIGGGQDTDTKIELGLNNASAANTIELDTDGSTELRVNTTDVTIPDNDLSLDAGDLSVTGNVSGTQGGSMAALTLSGSPDGEVDLDVDGAGEFGHYVKQPNTAGSVSLVSGTASISFTTNLPNTSYAITFSTDTAGEDITWASKATTGFTINSDNGSSTATVDFLVTPF